MKCRQPECNHGSGPGGGRLSRPGPPKPGCLRRLPSLAVRQATGAQILAPSLTATSNRATAMNLGWRGSPPFARLVWELDWDSCRLKAWDSTSRDPASSDRALASEETHPQPD